MRSHDVPRVILIALAGWVGCMVTSRSAYSDSCSPPDFTPIAFPGTTDTQPWGISNSGLVVGTYDFGLGNTRGFEYSGGAFVPLDFPGALSTQPFGVNDSGLVVGDYLPSGPGQPQGFVYNGASFTPLNMPGASWTDPQGINDLGQITGSDGGSDARFHRFVWGSTLLITGLIALAWLRRHEWFDL
jgi:hypothetical protein